MKTQTLGDVQIRKLVEIDKLEVGAYWLLKNLTKEFLDKHRAELGPELVHPTEDKVFLSFHTFVVQTKHHNILIDTCNGNDKQRPSMPAWHMMKSPYMENLAAMGLRPEDIDMVMCTHLHTDHVGWNTKLENGRWVPTFPKARYFMSRVRFRGLQRPAQRAIRRSRSTAAASPTACCRWSSTDRRSSSIRAMSSRPISPTMSGWRARPVTAPET